GRQGPGLGEVRRAWQRAERRQGDRGRAACGLGDQLAAACRVSCQATPYLSASQANLSLNGYLPSGIMTRPPCDSFENSSSISASVSQVTNSEIDGVNVKPCFTGLSIHMNFAPSGENVACITEPSAPPWFLP